MPGGGARLGVDTGGTFTDLVLVTATGRSFTRKVSSTPDLPEAAILDGIGAILDEAGLAPGDLREVVHGTTVGSNALLQKRGARCGLITTRGFRDVLEIGRVRTPDLYDLTWEKPRPLVPRRLRLEVDERIAADGSVVRPLDEAGVVRAAERLVRAGVQVIAICFINSYANPAHEQAAERLVRQAVPGIDVTASYSVLSSSIDTASPTATFPTKRTAPLSATLSYRRDTALIDWWSGATPKRIRP